MPRHNWYSPGEWNFTCDICGRVYKSGQMMRGYGSSLDAVVCPQCHTPQQPQDFVQGIPDDQSVPVSRPWRDSSAYGIWINNLGAIIPWENAGGPIPWTP